MARREAIRFYIRASGIPKTLANASKGEQDEINLGRYVFSGSVRLSPVHLSRSCSYLKRRKDLPVGRILKLSAKQVGESVLSMLCACVPCCGMRGLSAKDLSSIASKSSDMNQVRDTIKVIAALHPGIKYTKGKSLKGRGR